ncbi:hypothetical protein vseg_012321 [Gypsophila vaccaria]
MSGDLVSPSTPHITKPVYALSHSDGVSAKITHVVLKGSNYTEWAKGFRNGLGAKRKLGFVDGSLKRPANGSADLDDWSIANYTVIAWIFNTIDPTIRSSISYRDTAVELWDDIRNRFSRGNGIKVYHLESEISDCKQKDDETLMEFFSRLKKLWDDVNDYDALPTCDCSGCKCNISDKLRQRREMRQTRKFLMGLLPFYSIARSHVLGITTLPSLDSVYSRIVQEEEVRNITQEHPTAMALAVQSGRQGAKQGSRDSNAPTVRNPATANLTVGTSMDTRRDVGHVLVRFPGASSSTAQTNAVFGESAIDVNHIRLHGKHAVTWLVDTGASTHVCENFALLDECVKIAPLAVGLPNGAHLKVTHRGKA